MPWEPYDKWSQAEKDAHAKEANRINKAWGEKNERERRERVANALGFEKDKSKVNSEASTSKSQKSLVMEEEEKAWYDHCKSLKSWLNKQQEKRINSESSTNKNQSSNSKSPQM
ncbi:MAG: hypothetical protein H9Q65_04440 [Spiroplasma ixodetis]|nr:hypothetical protein [Spiroplasma ixodetis]MBP1528471.1 hypothetical protein [Spiroplasma ixodetis]